MQNYWSKTARIRKHILQVFVANDYLRSKRGTRSTCSGWVLQALSPTCRVERAHDSHRIGKAERKEKSVTVRNVGNFLWPPMAESPRVNTTIRTDASIVSRNEEVKGIKVNGRNGRKGSGVTLDYQTVRRMRLSTRVASDLPLWIPPLKVRFHRVYAARR